MDDMDTEQSPSISPLNLQHAARHHVKNVIVCSLGKKNSGSNRERSSSSYDNFEGSVTLINPENGKLMRFDIDCDTDPSEFANKVLQVTNSDDQGVLPSSSTAGYNESGKTDLKVVTWGTDTRLKKYFSEGEAIMCEFSSITSQFDNFKCNNTAQIKFERQENELNYVIHGCLWHAKCYNEKHRYKISLYNVNICSLTAVYTKKTASPYMITTLINCEDFSREYQTRINALRYAMERKSIDGPFSYSDNYIRSRIKPKLWETHFIVCVDRRQRGGGLCTCRIKEDSSNHSLGPIIGEHANGLRLSCLYNAVTKTLQ